MTGERGEWQSKKGDGRQMGWKRATVRGRDYERERKGREHETERKRREEREEQERAQETALRGRAHEGGREGGSGSLAPCHVNFSQRCYNIQTGMSGRRPPPPPPPPVPHLSCSFTQRHTRRHRHNAICFSPHWFISTLITFIHQLVVEDNEYSNQTCSEPFS